jgi:hypothetical protein
VHGVHLVNRDRIGVGLGEVGVIAVFRAGRRLALDPDAVRGQGSPNCTDTHQTGKRHESSP